MQSEAASANDGTRHGHFAAVASEGIFIPSLLQPLLGLDFVPHLPSPEKVSFPKHHNNDEDDVNDELFLLCIPIQTNIHASSSLASQTAARGTRPTEIMVDQEDYDDAEAEMDDIDQSNQEQIQKSSLSFPSMDPFVLR